MSEGNEGSYNTSDRSKRKDDVVKAEWNPVTDKVTETHKDGTITQKEVVRGDDSPQKMASRNDTLADFRRNMVRLREVNSSTDTTQQANDEGNTSDN